MAVKLRWFRQMLERWWTWMRKPSIANAHRLLISGSEAQLLAGLIGCCLKRIRCDGASASLEFDSCTLVVCPEPGYGGSPLRPNKEEIMRLFVRPVTAEESARTDSTPHKQLDFGERVIDIHVLHSLVVFGRATEVGPLLLPGGVPIPAGLGYNAECINPSRVARGYLEHLTRQGCANLVDIGIVIGLEESGSVVIRTNGYAWRVLVIAEANGSAHQEMAAAIALRNRSAGPLSRVGAMNA